MEQRRDQSHLTNSDEGCIRLIGEDAFPNSMVFGSVGNKPKGAWEYVSNSSSILSLQPWIFRRDSHQVDRQNVVMDGEFDGKNAFGFGGSPTSSQVLPSPRNIRLRDSVQRRRSSIRSRRSRYSVLPLDSEDCLIPQLYGNDFEIEEFVFTPVSTPKLPSSRSFYIMDGSQLTSKSNCEQTETCHQNELGMKSSEVILHDNMTGIHDSPDSRKYKRKSPQVHREEKGAHNQRQPLSALLGTFDGFLLFLMGISIGTALTMTTKKREVDELSSKLKQSESLVEDLKEDLEMKNSLSIKELVNVESSDRQPNILDNETLQGSSGLFHSGEPIVHSGNEEVGGAHSPLSEKIFEHSQSFSKIEAELQAELERLELNMNRANSDAKPPFLDEFGGGQISEVIQGELCKGNLIGRHDEQNESSCNSRESTSVWTPPVNYSVSPIELSIRLHELKQSRLEERIRELEVALAQSQRHLHFTESDVMGSLHASSDMGSSSNQESPKVVEQRTTMACINLTGDTLEAYNEAYEEFTRTSEVEEKPPSPVCTGNKSLKNNLFISNGSNPWPLKDDDLGSLAAHRVPDEDALSGSRWSSELGFVEVRNARKDDDDDDYNDINDEEGRILIQQIVERTKRSSPFVLNVKQMLLSMDN